MSSAKHNTIVLFTAVIISASLFFVKRESRHQYTSKTFRSSFSGWGYDILVDDKLFIHQEFIPVLAGKEGFSQQKQAEQVAALIINKMKKGQPLTVTKFELQQICPVNELDNAQQRKN